MKCNSNHVYFLLKYGFFEETNLLGEFSVRPFYTYNLISKASARTVLKDRQSNLTQIALPHYMFLLVL